MTIIIINGSGTITGASTLATAVVSPTLTTPVVTSTLGVGNATPSGSGAGITFPATQSASTDANTLDDYEEGTWTPAISGLTFSQARGNYVKVGTLCYVTIELNGSNTSKTSVDIVITGLPFTSKTNFDQMANSIPFAEVANISLGSVGAAACILMYGRVNANQTNVQLLQTTGKAHDAFTVGGGLNTNATLRTSFCYCTAN